MCASEDDITIVWEEELRMEFELCAHVKNNLHMLLISINYISKSNMQTMGT